ncbi:MAG: diguanylate cyclase [Pseudomonadota bacterium]
MNPVGVLLAHLWRWRLPLLLLLFLALFTVIGLAATFQQQRALLLEQARAAGEAELAIIAGFSREALARGDYSAMAHFLEDYAGGHHHIRRLAVTSGDGARLWLEFDEYDGARSDERMRFEERIDYGAGRSVKLEMVVTGAEQEEALAQLRRHLTLWGMIGVLLFTLVLWLSVEQMGLKPLRRARDRLEVRVAERTDALESALAQVSEKAHELEKQASHDHLTGLYNRLKFEEFLEQEMERVSRYRQPFSLIIGDLDHFKRVNDTHGHTVGDDVLVELSRRLAGRVRKLDRVARWGGEEFVVLLPETGLEAAVELAERLREEVEKTPFPVAGTLTMSFGVTACSANDSRQRLLLRVDKALYQAKEEGRNRVVASSAEE